MTLVSIIIFFVLCNPAFRLPIPMVVVVVVVVVVFMFVIFCSPLKDLKHKICIHFPVIC